METKNKVITMSLETAREIWASSQPEEMMSVPGRGAYGTDIGAATRRWLLENYSLEDLEPKEGFTWQDSFSQHGYKVCDGEIRSVHSAFKDVFKTEKQALSALAFAQLSHIVSKYNEGICSAYHKFFVERIDGKLMVIQLTNCEDHLPFHTREDAEASMRVNRELWNQYWML